MFLEGGASKSVNGIGTAGKLALTDGGISFKSKGGKATIFAWQQIVQVSCYKSLGVIPNGFSLLLENGKLHHFIVDSRVLWQNQINKGITESKKRLFHPDLG